MEFCQLANGPFKLWEIHFASEDIKEVQRTILDAPGCANAKVSEFSILIRSVPTLQDLIEAVRLFIRTIEFEPLAFNNNAGLWLGILLILRHEIVVSHFRGAGPPTKPLRRELAARSPPLCDELVCVHTASENCRVRPVPQSQETTTHPIARSPARERRDHRRAVAASQ